MTTFQDAWPFLSTAGGFAVGALGWWRGNKKDRRDASNLIAERALEMVERLQADCARLQTESEHTRKLQQECELKNTVLTNEIAKLRMDLDSLQARFWRATQRGGNTIGETT